MKIVRATSRHGSILPEAFLVISKLPDDTLHHLAHGRRAPVSLYRRSLYRIAEDWHLALDKIDKFNISFLCTGDDALLPDVVSSYAKLLHRLYEHFDASYGCLRTLFPLQAKNPPIDQQFLDNVKPPGWDVFKSRTKLYNRYRLGPVVNALKHNQADMSYLYIHGAHDVRVGYYISDVQENGILGPSLKVHPDGNSAFSFAYDMLIHFWNLYFMSSELATVVRRVAACEKCVELEQCKNDDLESMYMDLARRVSGLPLAFFPDEIKQPCPLVRWNPEAQELSIEMPGAARARRLSSSYKVCAALTVDMGHPINKIPYAVSNSM